jgi:uncharacterized coiled-coil DUF342 family protein
MKSLIEDKMYVLGPLELCPGQFAVGERSYEAIKGKMSYYNSMRQNFYLEGRADAGDAIGELEARAVTAEKAFNRMKESRRQCQNKIKHLTEVIDEFKKEYPQQFKKLEAARKEKNSEVIVGKVKDTEEIEKDEND